MTRHLDIAIRMTILTAVLLGLLYPLAITGIAQVLFPGAANGSLVKVNDKVVGSTLIAPGLHRGPVLPPAALGGRRRLRRHGLVRLQPRADQPRPRRPGAGGRPQADRPEPGPALRARAGRHGDDVGQRARPGHHRRQRTRSGAARRSGARPAVGAVLRLVARTPTGRTLGFLGEPRVNVLELNLALDAAKQRVRRVMVTDETAGEAYSLRTLRKRGQLKVFLGYAPGVGKTFSMLAEAHRRVLTRRGRRHRLRGDARAQRRPPSWSRVSSRCRSSASSIAARRSRSSTPPP